MRLTISSIYTVLLFVAGFSLHGRCEPVYTDTLSAKGSEESVFSLKRWGRYSIEVENPEGSSLHLIDRRQGLREKDGVIGEESGRIECFLDTGEYKVVVNSHKEGSGKAVLRVSRFEELNSIRSEKG